MTRNLAPLPWETYLADARGSKRIAERRMLNDAKTTLMNMAVVGVSELFRIFLVDLRFRLGLDWSDVLIPPFHKVGDPAPKQLLKTVKGLIQRGNSIDSELYAWAYVYATGVRHHGRALLDAQVEWLTIQRKSLFGTFVSKDISNCRVYCDSCDKEPIIVEGT